jgi:hypothetical protein
MTHPIVTPTSDPGGWVAVANARVPPGYVRLSCDDPPLDVLALLGEGSPRLTGGFGGWDVVARPQQVGMTVWTGVEPLSFELPILLDGFAARRSQEPDQRKLYAVARGDDESPPGVVRVAGVPLPVVRWVIEQIDVGDSILRTSDGSRLRQALTLTLREYVPPTYLQLRRSALKGTKGKTKVITVKRGDTPASIARKQRCAWTELRSLNVGVVKKANQALKVGSKLRVPVADAHRRRAKGSRRSSKS